MIRAELLKLRLQRTPQILWGLATLVVLIVIGITIGKDLSAAEYAQRADNAVFIVTTILAGVLGGFVMGSEYRQDTLKRLAAVGPRRGRIVAAKLGVLVGTVVVGTTALYAIAVGAMSILASNAGTSYPTAEIWPTWANGMLWAVTIALIGFGLSLLTRSDTFAMIGSLGIPLVLDPLAGAMVHGANRWTLSGAVNGFTAHMGGAVNAQAGPEHFLVPAAAGALLLVWVLAPLVLGARRFTTADI